MRKFLQVNLICALVLLAFFPPESSHAESTEDGCGQMAFHIFTVKEDDEIIKGQSESGSEIELEIGDHKDTASADGNGQFEFNIESLRLSEGETVVLINDQHEIDTEVSAEDAEEMKIESVLQGECEITEEMGEVQEDESEESKEISEEETVDDVDQEMTEEAVEEVRETESEASEEVSKENAAGEANKEVNEASESEEPEEKSHQATPEIEKTEEFPEEVQKNQEEKAVETEVEELGESDDEPLEEEVTELGKDPIGEVDETIKDDEGIQLLEQEMKTVDQKEESVSEKEFSISSLPSSITTASENGICQTALHSRDELMEESCLHTEVKGDLLSITYTGWGKLWHGHPDPHDKFINFHLPSELSEVMTNAKVTAGYKVPAQGNSGTEKAEDFEESSILHSENSDYIHINFDTILDTSHQNRNREYQFILNIELDSLPPAQDGEYIFYAFTSRDHSKALDSSSLENTPKVTIEAPKHEGVLAFKEVPSSMNFETTEIRPSNKKINVLRSDNNWNMKVEDTRRAGSEFHVTAKAENPLSTADGTHSLPEALVYVNEEEGGQSLPIYKDAVKIFSGMTGKDDITEISWPKDEGILIQVNPIEAQAKEYGTTIEWTLTDGP